MFDSFLRNEVNRLKLPGLAVAITCGEQELFAAGYGHCDAACRVPTTPDTLFGIASVTKFITALRIMQLQEQGKLSLTDPVRQFYPNLEIASENEIQLHHLLSHTSGLPGLPCRFYAENLQNTEDSSGGSTLRQPPSTIEKSVLLRNATDLPDFINKLGIDLLSPPGTLLNYSNEGYCLLGGIIESLTSKTYQQQVEKTIFKPLNMKHSVVGGNTRHYDNIALPLVKKNPGFAESKIWDTPLFYSAGGVLSSARELTRLMGVLSDNDNFLTIESRQALLQPAINVASRPDSSIGYGFGLEYQMLGDNSAIHWHTGQRTGVSSFVCWVTGRDIAVSVLTHIADVPVAGIGFAIINKLLERQDLTWPQFSSGLSADFETGYPLDINSFHGRYCSREGFDFQIESSGTDLFLHSESFDSPQLMRFTDSRGGIVGNQSFRFLLNHNKPSTPWALALDLRILLCHGST